jgi:hypothetical protein
MPVHEPLQASIGGRHRMKYAPASPPKLRSWAPGELLDLRAELSTRAQLVQETDPSWWKSPLSPAWQIELIDRLLTDRVMADVWRVLQRRVSKPTEIAAALVHALTHEARVWHYHPKLTKAKSVSAHQNIAVHALALRRALSQLKDPALERTERFIHNATRERMWKLFRPNNGTHSVFTNDVAQYDKNRSDYGPDMRSFTELLECLPPIEEILADLATRAPARSTAAATLKQSNNPKARLHHFLYSISSWLKEQCQGPLHAQLTTLANITLSENVNEDSVRLFLRQRRKAMQARR